MCADPKFEYFPIPTREEFVQEFSRLSPDFRKRLRKCVDDAARRSTLTPASSFLFMISNALKVWDD